jgi:HSP20 family protein
MGNVKKAVPKTSLTRSSDLLLQRRDLLDPFTVHTWVPHVDLCQTEDRVLIRAELPGVALPDIRLTFEKDILRLEGIKRETDKSLRRRCYYCLERRYGKFDRCINIDWIVNPREIHASLNKGILTVEIPKLRDRRGTVVEIPIKKIG